MRKYRRDYQGNLITKGGRGRTCLRFCCCTLLIALFLFISIVLSLALVRSDPYIVERRSQLNLALVDTSPEPHHRQCFTYVDFGQPSASTYFSFRQRNNSCVAQIQLSSDGETLSINLGLNLTSVLHLYHTHHVEVNFLLVSITQITLMST